MRLGDGAEFGADVAFRQSARTDSDSILAPVLSFGVTYSSIACMICGTPAMTMTLPIQKPGAAEILLSTNSAPCGNARHAHARLVHHAAGLATRAVMISTARGSWPMATPKALATRRR